MFSLYAKGFSHVVDGVQCDLIRVEERDLDHYRSQGWVDDVHSLNKPEKTKKEKVDDVPAKSVGNNSNDIKDKNSDSK